MYCSVLKLINILSGLALTPSITSIVALSDLALNSRPWSKLTSIMNTIGSKSTTALCNANNETMLAQLNERFRCLVSTEAADEDFWSAAFDIIDTLEIARVFMKFVFCVYCS